MNILDIIKLYRYHKNINLIDKENQRKAIKHCIIAAKNMDDGSIRRKLTCSILKQLRQLNPHIVLNFTEDKLLYDNYFKLDNHISSYDDLLAKINLQDVYVTLFRSKTPVKGDRYCEYYTDEIFNSSGKFIPIVYKLTKENIKKSYINMNDPAGFANVFSIRRDAFTNYRYSTHDEETNFDFCEAEISKIKIELELKQKETAELYSRINILKKSIWEK